MAKEGSSNSDFNKKVTPSGKNDNLQFNFMEEMKMKNPPFKREMKVFKEEMEEEIQQIKSEHKKEIKNLEENFQQSIIEKIQANNQQIINHLEIKFEDKYGNEIAALKQKVVELSLKSEQKDNSSVNFVQIKNKWSEIKLKCCENKCINTDKPVGNCIEGNGFINIIDGGNIKYINCVGEGENKAAGVTAENKLNTPKNDCINYSLFYFEIKCKIEGVKSDENWMVIGIRNGNNAVKLDIDEAFVRYESIINKNIKFKIPKFSWNDGDVFGFGLVYPPTKINELPYVFFTQNGKQIGKSLLLKNDGCDNYKISAHLKRCSIVANFGNDLKTKPFVYNITEHLAPKEFYVDSDGSIVSSLTSMMAAMMASRDALRMFSDDD
uniref:SPRY domain n=1 Tax=Meloidogyne incognita TaxID=6306 RepID=A0A914LXN8_MELIC